MTEINAVSREYAATLFQLAKENKEIVACGQNLQILSEALQENKDFLKIMLYPNLKKEEKKQIIKQILKLDDGYFLYFLYVLIDNNRFEELVSIDLAYQELIKEEQGILDAKVYTKYQLTDKQVLDIKQKLEKQFAKTITIEEIVNPDIVGGIKIVVKGIEYDYTIDSQLVSLKEKIMKG